MDIAKKHEQENIVAPSPEKILMNLDKDYKLFLQTLKEKIRTARLRAALAINREVIELYWHIGKQIIEKQH